LGGLQADQRSWANIVYTPAEPLGFWQQPLFERHCGSVLTAAIEAHSLNYFASLFRGHSMPESKITWFVPPVSQIAL
jgi:hypothetical protein